jgi:hypothetical protein
MLRTTVIVGALAILFLVAAAQGRGSWEPHGKRDGVAVWVAVQPDSDVPRVKAMTIVDAPTDQVWTYITGPGMELDGLKVRKRMGSCGDSCEYIYFRLGNWMIEDRHYVVKMQWRIEERDGQRHYSRWWTMPAERQPHGQGAASIHNIQGSWQLESVDGGRKTRVIYINHLDLGGDVPSGLYSIGFVKSAYEILGNIRNEA